MLTIGVTSDTHIPARARGLPQALISAFCAVDLILHTGDLTAPEVLDELSDLAPVQAVFGNMDDWDVRGRLEARKIVEIEGCRIGLIHGSGPPLGLHFKALDAFREDRVQAVVFGHSHQPYNQRIGNVLLFNPGSPTDARSAPYRTFGKLSLKGDVISGKIIKLDDQQ